MQLLIKCLGLLLLLISDLIIIILLLLLNREKRFRLVQKFSKRTIPILMRMDWIKFQSFFLLLLLVPAKNPFCSLTILNVLLVLLAMFLKSMAFLFNFWHSFMIVKY